MTATVDPVNSGSSVTCTNDAADRLCTVQDWLGHTTHFSYDNANNLTGESYPNGTSAAFSHDDANRLMDITGTTPAGPLWVFGYGRDNAGRLRARSDPLDGDQHTCGYDTLNHLTSRQQRGTRAVDGGRSRGNI